MPKAHIPHLEMHVTHACNLACESCSHYSNHHHKGHVELTEADAWMSAWSRRVTVGLFSLLGGEPTIHPDLPKFIPLARRHWPRARIEIVTNGFFLDRHEDLPEAMAGNGDVVLAVSVHHDSPDYRARLRPILDLARRWQVERGVQVEVRNSHRHWTRRYRGYGDTMSPFDDGKPRLSWEICSARECRQLFEFKLWKCSPIAYLELQKRKFRLSPQWDRYLSYRPLESSCEDREIEAFLAREEEGVCGMCSAMPRFFAPANPLATAVSDA